MEKQQQHTRSQQADSVSNQPKEGKEETEKNPNHPSIHPFTPAKPDKNPDPTKPIPGINEPEKTDPSRIEEPLKTGLNRSKEEHPAISELDKDN